MSILFQDIYIYIYIRDTNLETQYEVHFKILDKKIRHFSPQSHNKLLFKQSGIHSPNTLKTNVLFLIRLAFEITYIVQLF